VIDGNFQFSNNFSTNDIREIGNATGDSDLTFGLECRKPFAEMKNVEALYAQVRELYSVFFFSRFERVCVFQFAFSIVVSFFSIAFSSCSCASPKSLMSVRMVRKSRACTRRSCH
jgi:hypothetical protein